MPIVYRSRVFDVEVDLVTLLNGKEHEAASWSHMPSVVLRPIDESGQVILVRQFRHSVGRELWELPAGSLDPGEAAEAAAARECEEEITLVPGRIERIREALPAPGFCDEVLIYFRLSDLREPAPDSAHAPD